MMQKKIAILLAAYNGDKFISEQIGSIINQNEFDFDLYISVDMSVDASLDICTAYSNEHDNIMLLPYGRYFGSAGKNFYRLLNDVDLNCYDYIAFSDQDDIWPADKLAKAIKRLQQYDCYSANVTAFWENGCEVLIDKAQPPREWDFLFEAAGPGCTYVFKREVAMEFKSWLLERYQQIGEDIALHDWLLYAFARSHGYSWFIDPEPAMRYRQHANNQVGTNNSVAAANKRLRMIKSKWYRKQATKIAEHLDLLNIPIVKYGLKRNYLGNLYLLFHINKVRRRLRDRIALSFALLFNIF